MAFSQANRIKVAKLIKERKDFNHASMSGRWVNEWNSDWGRLSYETKQKMKDLLKDRDLYIVYSYQTPIAYAYDQELHIPDNHFSNTTSHHQTIVKLTDHYASL